MHGNTCSYMYVDSVGRVEISIEPDQKLQVLSSIQLNIHNHYLLCAQTAGNKYILLHFQVFFSITVRAMVTMTTTQQNRTNLWHACSAKLYVLCGTILYTHRRRNRGGLGAEAPPKFTTGALRSELSQSRNYACAYAGGA